MASVSNTVLLFSLILVEISYEFKPLAQTSVVKRGVNVSLPHLELGLLGGKKKRQADGTAGGGGNLLGGLLGGVLGGKKKRQVTTTTLDPMLERDRRGVNVSLPGIADLGVLGGKKRSIVDMADCNKSLKKNDAMLESALGRGPKENTTQPMGN